MRALFPLLLLSSFAFWAGCQTVEGVPEREDQDAGADASHDAQDASDASDANAD
jgi:predicted small secreted protein